MKIITTTDSADTAAEILQQPGAVILVPTETVYGLACSWNDSAARAKIYEFKHRSENKPFAAFVANTDALPDIVQPLPSNAVRIAQHFCPGPVTLVVPDQNGDTFGFRIPDHPFIQQLLRSFNGPLASTSANLSGTPAALNVADALASIDGEPQLVVDGGPLPNGSKASTVIKVFADNSWKILREGPVSAEQIKSILLD